MNITDDQILGVIHKLGDADGWVERRVLRAALGNPQDGVLGFNLHSAMNRLIRAGRVEVTPMWDAPCKIRPTKLDTH